MWILRRLCSCDGTDRRIAHLAAERTRACPVDRTVDDDPVQPRAERTTAVEALQRADGCEERLLRDVLSSGCVVYDEVRGAICTWPVVAEQRLQVGDGSILCAPDSGALVA